MFVFILFPLDVSMDGRHERSLFDALPGWTFGDTKLLEKALVP